MEEQDREIINEFLIESTENLGRLEQEMVELEQRPRDAALLASIFRTFHSIKGTCGFLGFSKLEAVTHISENLLSKLREGELELTPALVSVILETVDTVKRVLATIESTGQESDDSNDDLRRRLQAACDAQTAEPAAAGAPAAPEGEAARSSSVGDSTIRVDVGLLDKLMNLVGELVLARNQVLQFTARQEDATFNATSQRLNLITTELQAGVMKTRMQPIGMVWNKLPRVVRDLAATCGKQISLEMDGAETELDRTIIEAIKDPLTHLVRNSCDHGIERPEVRVRKAKPATGRLLLRAFHEGGHVNIEITDDGAGIDLNTIKSKAVQKGLLRPEQAERMGEREALNLIFLPGFSTVDQVSNLSGRGVGMDVVKTNIEKIGGVVDLHSRPGQGTTIKIKIPLTLAIIPGLVVTAAGERFVIPQVSLLELIRLEGEAGRKLIERVHGTPVYRRRGKLLPIAYLNRVLGDAAGGAEADVVNIVVLQAEDQVFGLVVDGINDTQEIVVKPLGKQLKGLSCYAGATIMGDGRVALILDVMGIAHRSGVVAEMRETARAEGTAAKTDRDGERQTLLLFRTAGFERLAVPLSLVARLEEIPQSKIERAAGSAVVQYRGQILPLVSLSVQLNGSGRDTASAKDPAQVIVFSDGERRVGILVDEILDIVDETVTARRAAGRSGLLGSAVVGQKVTDFVDLHAVIAATDDTWFAQRGPAAKRATVLVADGSPFSRGLLRNYLEMAGHRVVEAGGAQEAADKLGREKIDVVVSALDLATGEARDLAERVRAHSGGPAPPVLALTNRGDEVGGDSTRGFADCQLKFDRDAMLRSVERLAAAVRDAGQPVPEVIHG